MQPKAFLDASQGIRIENCEGGILIAQGAHRFVARRFKLTEDFRCLVGTAVALGFAKLWQCGSPIGGESSRITFSASHAERSWVFALGRETRPPLLERVIFPAHFRSVFEASEFEWVQQGWGRRDLLISPRDLTSAIRLIRQSAVDQEQLARMA